MIKMVVIVLVVVVGVALAAAFGPLNSLLPSSTPSPTQPAPQATPSPTPTPTPTPTVQPTTVQTVTSQPSPSPSPTVKKVVRTFTEKELQDLVNAMIPTINQSGQAKVDFLQVKLDQDRMLVSAKGQALGQEAETKDLAVYFDAKTITAEGQIAVKGLNLTFNSSANITCNNGKPALEFTNFQLGGALVMKFVLPGLTTAKISQMVTDAIVSKGLTILCRVESISIENSKLTLVFTQ